MSAPRPPDTIEGGFLGEDADEPARPGRLARLVPLLLAGLAGLVIGASGAAALHRPDPPPRPPALDLQVSLGVGASGLVPASGRLAVVGVPIVVRNAGSESLMLVAIKITGAGAGYLDGPSGGPGANLPRPLGPGQEAKIRFGLTSDCGVPLRPQPTVQLGVRDGTGRVSLVPVRIPDLDALWGLTLFPDACARAN